MTRREPAGRKVYQEVNKSSVCVEHYVLIVIQSIRT